MAAVKNPIITVRDLSFGYPHKQQVLSNAHCAIEEHRFTIVIGQNGSGKSTFLRTMAGILPYHSGSIHFRGKELKLFSTRERARLIGYLGQHHKPIFPFKVSEVVLTGRAPYISYLPGKFDQCEAEKAMDWTGITHLKDRIYTELSGGEQRLVMIARILAQQPEVLLMDEPISHLDYNNQLRIIQMIRHLVHSKITVVAVLHDPNMAFQFGESFIYVHNKTTHGVEGKHAWKHPLVREIFHDDLEAIECDEKYIFRPRL